MSYLEQILEQLKREGHFETKKQEFNPKEEAGNSEILDLIDKFELNFNLGTAVAHILSTGLGNCCDMEKLQIAAWYLHREIERLDQD
jgi:hypothetical protein